METPPPPPVPAIRRLLLLGATGDLAGRFLLPALAALSAAGELPPDFRLVGAGPQDWDDDRFRAAVAARLDEHAPGTDDSVRRALLERLRYRRVDLADPATVAAAVAAADGGSTPVAVYLALPPTLFPAALRALADVRLAPGSRIAVEKPFGADLAGARQLNALLLAAAGAEDAAVRVDHALGMPRVQTLLALRAGALAPVWNGDSLAQVDLLWEEALGLPGRAAFYDTAGTVRDVLQNHVLQVLTLATMELPGTADEAALHRAKLDLLRAVRVPGGDLATHTRRGRYTAGQLPGGPVPDYVAEDGVEPARGTETYAELVLSVDTPRWAGTRFVLRAGKALAASRTGLLLHLRDGAAAALPAQLPAEVERAADGAVWLGLNEAGGQGGELAAYRRVLGDVIGGGSRTSVSAEEAEQAWQVVDPVLRGWAADEVPLLEYPAGSAGPGLLPA